MRPKRLPSPQRPGHTVMPPCPSPGPHGTRSLTAEPLWPASPRSPGTPTSPCTRRRGVRVWAGSADVGGGGAGGRGRWGHLLGCQALLRGRPPPALQLGPAQDGRALSAHTAPPSRPGRCPYPRPRTKKPRTSSPFSPLDPARPGRPCASQRSGLSTPKGGTSPCASPHSGTPGRGPPPQEHRRKPRALTGSPLGPFSPKAPLRPDSPCGGSGDRLLRPGRPNSRRPPAL